MVGQRSKPMHGDGCVLFCSMYIYEKKLDYLGGGLEERGRRGKKKYQGSCHHEERKKTNDRKAAS